MGCLSLHQGTPSHPYRNEVPQHHRCDPPSNGLGYRPRVLNHQHGCGCGKFGTKRPQVQIRLLVDGGIAEHSAIQHAINHGADEVYLLPTGFPCALVAAPTTAVGVALQALTLLSQQQLIGEVARYNGPAKLKVLPPLCPLKVSAADFSRADELIARARTATGSWIDAGGPDLPTPQRFLSMHDHKKPRAIARQDLDRANGRRTASSPH
jgi:hypothetical protein